jgi:hypothetical protein
MKAAKNGAVVEDQVLDLLNFEKSAKYSERQKAALAYAEAIIWRLAEGLSWQGRHEIQRSEPQARETDNDALLLYGRKSADEGQALGRLRWGRPDFRFGRRRGQLAWRGMLDQAAAVAGNGGKSATGATVAAAGGRDDRRSGFCAGRSAAIRIKSTHSPPMKAALRMRPSLRKPAAL